MHSFEGFWPHTYLEIYSFKIQVDNCQEMLHSMYSRPKKMYVHIPQSVINLLPLFQFLQMKSLLAVLTTWPKLSLVASNFDLNLICKFYSKKAAQVEPSFWNTSELIKQLPAKQSSQSRQDVWINCISYEGGIFGELLWTLFFIVMKRVTPLSSNLA